VHTRFLGAEAEALSAFDVMKGALAVILSTIPDGGDPDVDEKARRVSENITAIVERYP
jgi:hypothetical protein